MDEKIPPSVLFDFVIYLAFANLVLVLWILFSRADDRSFEYVQGHRVEIPVEATVRGTTMSGEMTTERPTMQDPQ
jgi:hypothetical protein